MKNIALITYYGFMYALITCALWVWRNLHSKETVAEWDKKRSR